MVVWIQFPAFLVHFYHKEILFTLGNMVGRAIKLDFHTQHQQRAKFARMAVELDLSKPLVTRIRLDGKWQYIEYENLPTCCFECGKIGHTSLSCPNLAAKNPLPVAGVMCSNAPVTPPEDRSGFGPWMQVTRRSRRGTRLVEKGKANEFPGESGGFGKAGKGKNLQKDKESAEDQKREQKQRKETDRNGANEKGKTAGAGIRNGKEKADREVDISATGGKGVLGPIPPNRASPTKGPSKGVTHAKRTEVGPSSLGSGSEAGRDGPDGIQYKTGQSLLTSISTKALMTSGPMATSIQIVDVPTIDQQKGFGVADSSPSAATRTKNDRRKKKSKERHSPMKVAAKALQIWTPVKDKK
ncbi:unnamed protein product [Linum trigynum]|uniref:CCHC-type domain-containing protein n=1 Tax=Linum trigynum TaxID=586398 RepID=A0AAV2E3G6_9ROSI